MPAPPVTGQDRWLVFDGLVNARDSGGLPTRDGRRVAPHRLLRADNLQDLSAQDVRRLLEDIGVTDVLDLRSDFEVDRVGPGPLVTTGVLIDRLSLLPEAPPTDADRRPSGDELLPWQDGELAERHAVLDDYALTDDRIAEIAVRLRSSTTYAGSLDGRDLDSMRPRHATMETVLSELDVTSGGVPGWLAARGWTEADTAAVTAKLGLAD